MPTAIVESVSIVPRTNDAPRLVVKLSFPVYSNAELMTRLGLQVKNGVDVEFRNFQMRLPEDGGEPGPVPVHFFAPGDDPELCDFCGRDETDDVHQVREAQAGGAPETETVAMHVNGGTAPVEREVGNYHAHQPNGVDDKCKACGRPLMDEIHGEAPVAEAAVAEAASTR